MKNPIQKKKFVISTIFKGVVYEIEVFTASDNAVLHAITLRAEEPCEKYCDADLESLGLPYSYINGNLYGLSWSCYLYSDKQTTCSYFARNLTELKFIKKQIKKVVTQFINRDFEDIKKKRR